jgi:hypothetical protein
MISFSVSRVRKADWECALKSADTATKKAASTKSKRRQSIQEPLQLGGLFCLRFCKILKARTQIFIFNVI